MRLKSKDILTILSVLDDHLKNFKHKVFLFGSRLDDSKRGGDIDLLLLVEDEDFKNIYEKKYLLKFELEAALGDQRVDLTLTTQEKISQDMFISSIATQAVLLYSEA